MKIKPTAAKLCLLSAAVLTLLGIVLRTVAMFTCFDTEVGYFNASLLSTLLTVLSFAAVLVPAVLAVVTPKDSLPTAWPEPRRNVAPLFPCVTFILSALWMLLSITSEQSTGTLALVASILALVAGLYYFLLILGRLPVNALSAVGYAPILWALFAVAETYTDQFTTMNSPIKLILQFGFLSVMLMTTSELRFRLSKAAPRAALCFHCIALFFCLNAAIPTLIALAAGILDRPIHGVYGLALLGAGVYVAFRLVFYATMSTSEVAAEATETETYTATEPHDTDSDPDADTDHIIGE